MRTRPTIQAVDDPESTFYVLMRPGHEPVTADWPHPLLELAPDAVRLPSVTTITGHGTNYSKSSIVVSLAMNTEWVSPITQERRDLLAHRRRLAALKAWRAARPGRFLRSGRKRAKNAFVSEEELREVHSRHWVGFQSLRSISKERWQEWGYSSANTCMNSIHEAIRAYGLRTHDQGTMTARSNRARSSRRPGEDKRTHRLRLRRERGEIRGVQCVAIKTLPGRGRGDRCSMPALTGRTYCFAHDPEKADKRAQILAVARASRVS